MEPLRAARYLKLLKKRRGEIMITRQHLERERRIVDDSRDWLDRAAYESRINLLDRLESWYLDEIATIDRALIRVGDGSYGVCLGCRREIDSARLNVTPEAAFCASCQDLREKASAV